MTARSLAIATLALAFSSMATEPELWRLDSATELFAGEGSAMAISADGRLFAVPPFQTIEGGELEEPVAIAATLDHKGRIVVGTSHPARIYRFESKQVTKLGELEAAQITALISDGEDLIIATAAPASLHRIDSSGALSMLATLEEGGVWDLAVHDGSVWVAVGTPARVYELGARGLEKRYELPDLHARCLLSGSDRLLLGTSGKGLILELGEAGSFRVLADSAFTEIADLARSTDGAIWAAGVVGEPPSEAKPGDNKPSVSSSGSSLNLPTLGGKTATSELLRLTPEGALLPEHRFTEEVITSLSNDGDGILVGTGFQGALWRFTSAGGARLAHLDATQVAVLLNDGKALVTLGPTRVMRRAERLAQALYRSPAKVFEQPVRFGRYEIAPASGSVQLRFRSGVSDATDATWSSWTAWRAGAGGQVGLPPARALQWEVALVDEARAGAEIDAVTLHFEQLNLEPRLAELVVDEPGRVYLLTPPQSGEVIEVSHPDLNGLFTVLDPKQRTAGAGNGKPYYRLGYRTVRWKASDPNGDPLRFELALENRWGHRFQVRRQLEESSLAFDTSALPDGEYRPVLKMDDEARNPGRAHSSEHEGPWFQVDNSPPVLKLSGDDRQPRIVSSDDSPLLRLEVALGGESWVELAPVDGMLDGGEETFELEIDDSKGPILVRAADRFGNRSTIAVRER